MISFVRSNLLLFAIATTANPSAWPEESKPQPAYPLWDGAESVADYARKVNLPPTMTLDLGQGVKMELVLIPAGKFIMGTGPTPVDEERFRKKIATGQAVLAVSGITLLMLVSVVAIRAIRKKRPPQLSLGLLMLATVAAGGAVLGRMHWQHSELEHEAALMSFIREPDDEKPAHYVTLTQPFYMGKFPVTQEQYLVVIGMNPSHFRLKDNPVEMVTWHEAQALCKKLTAQVKHTFRLPSEAEWEFACCAGTNTGNNRIDNDNDLDRQAWYEANSKYTTHPVGLKEANAFGLFDMHGNVWQWCHDWHARDYYGTSKAANPHGPRIGALRVLRGGSCFSNPVYCRSTFRGGDDPDKRYWSIGFRVVMAPSPGAPRDNDGQ